MGPCSPPSRPITSKRPSYESLRNAGERVIADPVRDREALDLEAEPLQLLLDDLLGLVLAAHRAGCRDEPLQEGERVLGAFGDRVVEPVGVQTASSLNGRMSSPNTEPTVHPFPDVR